MIHSNNTSYCWYIIITFTLGIVNIFLYYVHTIEQEVLMKSSIALGSTPLHRGGRPPAGGYVVEGPRTWYRIANYDAMKPFLVSVSNPGNIWMFVTTTGGITAGRTSSDSSLFPYLTEDNIADGYGHTGSLTVFLVHTEGASRLWEPLGWCGPRVYETERSFYKTVQGDGVMFSETNYTLGLEYRYGWEGAPGFGVHRFSALRNIGTSSVTVSLLDGVRNVLPAGVSTRMQSSFSNLLDAYKRSEVDPTTGLGVYSLSAAPTDTAEPSESLRATTIWSYGLDKAVILLSDGQVAAFRSEAAVTAERDSKGKRGAYLRITEAVVAPSETREWGLCAEVEQDHVSVWSLRERLHRDKDRLVRELHRDIESARARLSDILTSNDGIQDVGHQESKYHHLSNVLFNIMRGGYFVDGYTLRREDFLRFVESWNRPVHNAVKSYLAGMPETMNIRELRAWCDNDKHPELRRLAFEYLPITFSRRHGDPSRPWNKFFIRTHDAAGKPIIGYQGNWRDIFQNWEALCLSFPEYFPSVITKFLNATTVDGYNPYRISDGGVDWEVPEPDDPWANIGYWGDHQIVYLSRLMEQSECYAPGVLARWLDDPRFVFADVPYRIKPFENLLEDPRNSITFDHDRNQQILDRVAKTGADGRLVVTAGGTPERTTLMEKLLILLLAKSANYVPGGGIWLNTQRPEWNDANNALAGWGLSVVTVSYLIRFIKIVSGLVQASGNGNVTLHSEVAEWLRQTRQTLAEEAPDGCGTPERRFVVLSRLGRGASRYRSAVYEGGLTGVEALSSAEVLSYLQLFRDHLVHTLRSTRLKDGSFESYQLLRMQGSTARIQPLYPMLEGQVAGLSSGILNDEEVQGVLQSLRNGPLYRADQHTYMLYPNRDIPGFLDKNTVDDDAVQQLSIYRRSREEWNHILERDETGRWHFNGSFHNARDVAAAAAHLGTAEVQELLDLFENTFHHASFTGRSGTFFAYEGLGSVYWHMVAKLLLAVQEQLIEAILREDSTEIVAALKARYREIRSGLGFNKTPAEYGAIPTDPYSHTPWSEGARQPGMTGQVKEEIITRFGELGLVVRNGMIRFLPELILDDQWRSETQDYVFTFCGVRFSVERADHPGITVLDGAGAPLSERNMLEIPADLSARIFARSGDVSSVSVRCSP